jgi:hypothetical protein
MAGSSLPTRDRLLGSRGLATMSAPPGLASRFVRSHPKLDLFASVVPIPAELEMRDEFAEIDQALDGFFGKIKLGADVIVVEGSKWSDAGAGRAWWACL